MARTALYDPRARVCISIGKNLNTAARRHAFKKHMDFSEMVERLLVAELQSKRSIAAKSSRFLKKDEPQTKKEEDNDCTDQHTRLPCENATA